MRSGRSLGDTFSVPSLMVPWVALSPRPQPYRDELVPVFPAEQSQPLAALPGPGGWTRRSFPCAGQLASRAHSSCLSALPQRPAGSLLRQVEQSGDPAGMGSQLEHSLPLMGQDATGLEGGHGKRR